MHTSLSVLDPTAANTVVAAPPGVRGQRRDERALERLSAQAWREPDMSGYCECAALIAMASPQGFVGGRQTSNGTDIGHCFGSNTLYQVTDNSGRRTGAWGTLCLMEGKEVAHRRSVSTLRAMKGKIMSCCCQPSGPHRSKNMYSLFHHLESSMLSVGIPEGNDQLIP